jgi:hypothetical protein
MKAKERKDLLILNESNFTFTVHMYTQFVTVLNGNATLAAIH